MDAGGNNGRFEPEPIRKLLMMDWAEAMDHKPSNHEPEPATWRAAEPYSPSSPVSCDLLGAAIHSWRIATVGSIPDARSAGT